MSTEVESCSISKTRNPQTRSALAKETGETLTAAVTQAIREPLETCRRSPQRDKTLAALMEIGNAAGNLRRSTR